MASQTDTYKMRDGLHDVTQSSEAGEVVTPHDSTDLSFVTRGLWVGGAGNISVEMYDPQSVATKTLVIQGVQAGTLLPIRIERVNSTSTTATLMVALF